MDAVTTAISAEGRVRRMGRIGKKTMENLREGLSRGCEFTGTQEMVHETFLEALEELGGVGDWDEMAAEDLEGQMCVLQSLFEEFYDRLIEKVLNFIETEE